LTKLAYKIYLFALTFGFMTWIFHVGRKMTPDDQLFMLVISVPFLFFYLLTPAVFGAKLDPTRGGLNVEQWTKCRIAYQDIKRCYGFYLFPWQVVVVTTKLSFPLNVLFAGDKLIGERRSLIQDGQLAAKIIANMALYSGGVP